MLLSSTFHNGISYRPRIYGMMQRKHGKKHQNRQEKKRKKSHYGLCAYSSNQKSFLGRRHHASLLQFLISMSVSRLHTFTHFQTHTCLPLQCQSTRRTIFEVYHHSIGQFYCRYISLFLSMCFLCVLNNLTEQQPQQTQYQGYEKMLVELRMREINNKNSRTSISISSSNFVAMK